MKTKLEEINELFLSRRQQGHTEALIRGALATPNSTIIVHSKDMKDVVLKRLNEKCQKVKVVSMYELKQLKKFGPVMVDNAVFYMMAIESMKASKRKTLSKYWFELEQDGLKRSSTWRKKRIS